MIVPFVCGVLNAWTVATILLLDVTAGAHWALAVLATGGLAAGVLWGRPRFQRQALKAAFAGVPVDDLAASSLEVPFYSDSGGMVLGVGVKEVSLLAMISGPTDVEASRSWAELREVQPMDVHVDTAFIAGGSNWQVKRGPVVCLRFADGEKWLIPTDAPDELLNLVRARAHLES